jgi:uncharacterized DUF497 family protein
VQVTGEEVVDDEEREAVVGLSVDWRLLCVVYVMREEVVRIISARLVTNAERRNYEEQ